MPFYYRHFPTFNKILHIVWHWYKGRDLFERSALHIVAILLFFGGLYYVVLAPPVDFPQGAYIQVMPGTTLGQIGNDFKNRGLVEWGWLFKTLVKIFGDDRHVPAGVYYFPKSENLIMVTIRIASGDFETTPIKVRIPEGATVADIARILLNRVPDFDRNIFLSHGQAKEGYLFPDTYFFMPGDSADAILSVFSNGFQSHINKIQAQIVASKKPLPELVTMASLLEKEASDLESKRVIAGILWHRIKLGMPLQVDAVFPYIIGKNSLQLTLDDLKVDSPYNTYIHKGLPPGPIDNPSLDSLLAAATPAPSNYLYYLSDKQGNFHYAATYAEFLTYKHKYLGS